MSNAERFTGQTDETVQALSAAAHARLDELRAELGSRAPLHPDFDGASLRAFAADNELATRAASRARKEKGLSR